MNEFYAYPLKYKTKYDERMDKHKFKNKNSVLLLKFFFIIKSIRMSVCDYLQLLFSPFFRELLIMYLTIV
jgi:hypothetical protein